MATALKMLLELELFDWLALAVFSVDGSETRCSPDGRA